MRGLPLLGLSLLLACRHDLPAGDRDGPRSLDRAVDGARVDRSRDAFDHEAAPRTDRTPDRPKTDARREAGAPKLDAGRDAPKLDAGRDAPKLDAAKPDAAKPDAAKLDVPKLEITKPADAKLPYVAWTPSPSSPAPCGSATLVGGGGSCSSPLAVLRLDGHDFTVGCQQMYSLTSAWAACAGPALQGVTVTATSTCPPGKLVVGGGCDCGNSVNVVRSFPNPAGTSWSCWCANGAPTAVQIACAAIPVSVRNGACQGTEQLIGGGCECGPQNLMSSTPDLANNRWNCQCGGGAATPYSICAQ